MKKNMGTADRAVRTLIAVVIGFLYFTGRISGTLAIVLGIVAVVFLLTSLVGHCPAYGPLGMSTCGKSGDSAT
jgi:Inner membrane protein YgaP-like, transmembrane domain